MCKIVWLLVLRNLYFYFIWVRKHRNILFLGIYKFVNLKCWWGLFYRISFVLGFMRKVCIWIQDYGNTLQGIWIKSIVILFIRSWFRLRYYWSRRWRIEYRYHLGICLLVTISFILEACIITSTLNLWQTKTSHYFWYLLIAYIFIILVIHIEIIWKGAYLILIN
jgi:hypothetical protein